MPPTDPRFPFGIPVQVNLSVDADKTSDKDEACDAKVALLLIDDLEPELFCNELEVPSIYLKDDVVEPVWPLQHPRVRSWVAELFHSKCHRFISNRDVDSVMRVLEGRAWKAPRRPATSKDAWQRIEREAVSQSLILYANSKGEFEGLTRKLYETLMADDNIQHRLRLTLPAYRFPVNTQVFSRRVEDVRPALKMIGVVVTIEHKQNGSNLSLELKENFTREPDAISVNALGIASVLSSRDVEGSVGTEATEAKIASRNQTLELLTNLKESKS